MCLDNKQILDQYNIDVQLILFDIYAILNILNMFYYDSQAVYHTVTYFAKTAHISLCNETSGRLQYLQNDKQGNVEIYTNY